MEHLPSLYQEYIHLSRYSRFLPDEKRRETWPETVSRYFDFFQKYLKENHNYNMVNRKELEQAVLGLNVMPSMRCLMTAGPASEKENLSGFNCSYLAIDRPTSFDESLYILTRGTGVGFSVESRYVKKLPTIADDFFESDTVIHVADSAIGWAKALKELIGFLYQGLIPKWDTSGVRPAGTPLVTMGGRASGPEPLEEVFRFFVETFKNGNGRKLTTLECMDLVCKIAQCIIVGGVRRSALICICDINDDLLRYAKSGQWWTKYPHRALSNISAAYDEKPTMEIFFKEWKALYDSKSGERGIFNRYSATKKISENERRDENHEFGTNPCAEIVLKSAGVCNLSEVILRHEDSYEDIMKKIEIATIFGTWQSTLTKFKYVSKRWKNNAEEERLLGVSFTGIMDCPLMNGTKPGLEKRLQDLKEHAIDVNKIWAKKLDINPSAAITTVKPSGTVSQLTNTSSGIHTRHSKYYIRTVRSDKKDPLAQMMVEMEFPVEDDMNNRDHMYVFSFPVQSPNNAIVRKDVSAIEHLELWKVYAKNWCEHNPSITVSVKEDEWLKVGAWIHEKFDDVCGISFLPHSEHIYTQAPYQECTKEEYEEMLEKMPKNIDWGKLSEFEQVDTTTASHELACTAGHCEI